MKMCNEALNFKFAASSSSALKFNFVNQAKMSWENFVNISIAIQGVAGVVCKFQIY